jgi:hypothetical protein
MLDCVRCWRRRDTACEVCRWSPVGLSAAGGQGQSRAPRRTTSHPCLPQLAVLIVLSCGQRRVSRPQDMLGQHRSAELDECVQRFRLRRPRRQLMSGHGQVRVLVDGVLAQKLDIALVFRGDWDALTNLRRTHAASIATQTAHTGAAADLVVSASPEVGFRPPYRRRRPCPIHQRSGTGRNAMLRPRRGQRLCRAT